MRLYPIAIAVATFGLAACGSVDYRDSNAAVDADPLCASRADRPGEPQATNCVRQGEAIYSSERPSQPVDFRKKGDD